MSSLSELLWGIRRADGSIIACSQGWAEDVHELAGLTIVRRTEQGWQDATP